MSIQRVIGIGVFISCFNSSHAQSSSKPTLLWSASVGCTEYLTAPLKISDLQGPSPSFIPKWQKGWGLDFALGRSIGKHGRILIRGIWDRVPLGYATDVEPNEHPALGFQNPVESLNSTYWARRISIGATYRYGWSISGRAKLELGVGILRKVNTNDYPLSVGEGAITDTAAIWILGLHTQVFAGNSPWHGRGEVQFTTLVLGNHALTLAYYVDVPFGNVYTNGSAILLGNTQYQTTLTFHQSGFIQGITFGYEYSWSRNLKKAAEREQLR